MKRTPDATMSEYTPSAPRVSNAPAKCDVDVSCAPAPAPSIGTQAKTAAGKAWSTVQKLFNSDPVAGPQGTQAGAPPG